MASWRRFPDVQRVLVTGLESLAGGPTHIGIETPESFTDRLPFVRVVRVGGFSDVISDFPTVDIDVWADTYTAAEALAERIRQYLCGPPPPIAVLDRAFCETAPRELPWGDGVLRRFGATYGLTTRRLLVSS